MLLYFTTNVPNSISYGAKQGKKESQKKLNNCFPKFWLFEQVSILKKNLKTLQIISIKILASFMRTWNDSGKKIEILQHSTRVLCLSLRTSRFQLVEVDRLLKNVWFNQAFHLVQLNLIKQKALSFENNFQLIFFLKTGMEEVWILHSNLRIFVWLIVNWFELARHTAYNHLLSWFVCSLLGR